MENSDNQQANEIMRLSHVTLKLHEGLTVTEFRNYAQPSNSNTLHWVNQVIWAAAYHKNFSEHLFEAISIGIHDTFI